MVEMARSSRKDMKLPAKLWGEAVRNFVHILNMSPTRALTGQTPYEAWSGKVTDISYF